MTKDKADYFWAKVVAYLQKKAFERDASREKGTYSDTQLWYNSTLPLTFVLPNGDHWKYFDANYHQGIITEIGRIELDELIIRG